MIRPNRVGNHSVTNVRGGLRDNTGLSATNSTWAKRILVKDDAELNDTYAWRSDHFHGTDQDNNIAGGREFNLGVPLRITDLDQDNTIYNCKGFMAINQLEPGLMPHSFIAWNDARDGLYEGYDAGTGSDSTRTQVWTVLPVHVEETFGGQGLYVHVNETIVVEKAPGPGIIFFCMGWRNRKVGATAEASRVRVRNHDVAMTFHKWDKDIITLDPSVNA